jgi:hypothetical protein
MKLQKFSRKIFYQVFFCDIMGTLRRVFWLSDKPISDYLANAGEHGAL